MMDISILLFITLIFIIFNIPKRIKKMNSIRVILILTFSLVGANSKKKAFEGFCIGRPDGNYENPENCASYIACSGGNKYVMWCQKNLYYDIKQSLPWGACVPTTDHCGGSVIPTQPPTQIPTKPPTEPPTKPPTDPPTEPPTKPPTEPSTKPPTDPPTEPPTKPPTEPPTDPPTKPPTEPPTKPPTEPPTQSPTHIPTQSPTDPPTPTSNPGCPETTTKEHENKFSCVNRKDGNYPNPTACDSYIACSGGLKYEMSCQPGLHFNWHKDFPLGHCDYPEEANCLLQ